MHCCNINKSRRGGDFFGSPGRFICIYLCVFCVFFGQLHMCYIIVTWLGGPDGIEAESLGLLSSFSALTLLVGSWTGLDCC